MLATVSCCICQFAFISTERDWIQSIRNIFIAFHNENMQCFHLHHSFSSHLDHLQGTFAHYSISVLDLSSSIVESCSVHWNTFLHKHKDVRIKVADYMKNKNDYSVTDVLFLFLVLRRWSLLWRAKYFNPIMMAQA